MRSPELIIVPALFIMIGFVIWVLVNGRQRSLRLKLTTEFNSKLLDRIGSVKDFNDFLQTEGGVKFMDSLTVERSSSRPQDSILRATQIGIVLIMLGLGVLTLGAYFTARYAGAGDFVSPYGPHQAGIGGERPRFREQKRAPVDPERMRMPLVDQRLQVPPVAAPQVPDRLAGLDLRKPERRRDVRLRQQGRREPAGGLEEDAVRYRIHWSAQRSRPPMTRLSAFPLSVRAYSTRTGWSSMTRRSTTPACSSSFSRCESMPSVTTSSSVTSSL